MVHCIGYCEGLQEVRASEQAGGGLRNTGKDTMTRLLMNLQAVKSEMGNGDFTMSSRWVFLLLRPISSSGVFGADAQGGHDAFTNRSTQSS
jgi:hypothetical protein